MYTITVDGQSVLVVKRRVRQKKDVSCVKNSPSCLETEPSPKSKNLIPFVRASFVEGAKMRLLWDNIPVSSEYVKTVLGEPTQVDSGVVWVIKIPTQEIIKIVIRQNAVSIWGFNKTKSIENWLYTFVASSS